MCSIRDTAVLFPLVLVLANAQVVDIPNLGSVRGIQSTFDGNDLDEFLGIPYAEPPVGNLRFARPQPKAAWTAELNAMQFGPACPQPAASGSTLEINEDCLNLNIIVPSNASEAIPVPVMLFIHGRGFRTYSGSEYIGRELAVTGNVIVVTINYRFLTFGFFSTGEDCFPGNYGLWDQRLAIEWVQDNIGAFGGDGTKITIVGEGREGATGVSSQILTPLNNNQLFQRAIVQSSQFDDISYIMSKEEAQELSNNLANTLQCNQTSWEEKVICLRGLPWADIVAASESLTLGGEFEPRVDGYFFPDSLDRLLERDNMNQYDIIAGVNSDEGIALMNGVLSKDDFADVEEVINFVWNVNLARYGDEERARLAVNAIEQRYVDLRGLPDIDTALRYVFDFFGDGYYVSPTMKFLRRHQMSTAANTYLYFFDYVDASYSLMTEAPRDNTRAIQGEELFYLWDTIFGRDTALNAPAGSTSASIRSEMIGYWMNFVNNGDPNSGESTPSTTWPEFDDETETYLLIADSITTAQNLKAEDTSFWLDYLPELTAPSESETCNQESPVPDLLDGVLPEPEESVTLNIADTEGEELGRVRGILRKADNGVGGLNIRIFYSIPYTYPPVGDRRFEYSELLDDWGEEIDRDATMIPPGCPQPVAFPVLLPDSFNEDCLYLNVFAPEVSDGADPLPVIVYLHSGVFQTGNGGVFDASQLASYADAVVVTLNYRLGSLGFLSTGDSSAPGNYGILDVVTALKWINKYIGSFGGNPDDVTAFGMGSGATVAQLISIYGLNEGFMHKIIGFGDTALSNVLLATSARDPLQFATRLADSLDCPTTSTSEIVACLRTKTAEELVLTDVGGTLFLAAFYPVWGGNIFPESPDKVIASGDYETLPTLLGATECDNNLLTATYYNDSWINGCPDKEIAGAIIDDAVNVFYEGNKEIAALFRMFYLESENSPTIPNEACPYGQAVSEFLSDIWLNVPFLETGRLMAQYNKEMYLYFLTYHPDYHVYQFAVLPWMYTLFGDDIPYAFGWPYDRNVTENYKPADRKVTINFMNMIASFAKTGIPTANPTDPSSLWQPYDPTTYNAMFLDVCPTQEAVPRGAEKESLWYEVIEGLKDSLLDRPTAVPVTEEPCVVDGFMNLGMTPEQAGRVTSALIVTMIVIGVLLVLGVVLYICLKANHKPVKPV